MSHIERVLEAVASELDWVDPAPVFIGGATLGLFLDEFGRSHLRPTTDIDCIIPAVTTYRKWAALEAQLRARGWAPAKEGPICRYHSPNGALVDLMAVDPSVLGFSGQWYQAAVDSAHPRRLGAGQTIRVPAPEHLFACKLEAWRDRGRSDPMVSKDLEDIVALLDGCQALEQAVRDASEPVRTFIGVQLRGIVEDPALVEIASAQLPPGGDVRTRERRLVELMRRMAGPDAA